MIDGVRDAPGVFVVGSRAAGADPVDVPPDPVEIVLGQGLVGLFLRGFEADHGFRKDGGGQKLDMIALGVEQIAHAAVHDPAHAVAQILKNIRVLLLGQGFAAQAVQGVIEAEQICGGVRQSFVVGMGIG